MKKSVGGGPALLLTRKVFVALKKGRTAILRRQVIHECWDWRMVGVCRFRWKMLSTKDSYVDHIGFIGTHSAHRCDVAISFLASPAE